MKENNSRETKICPLCGKAYAGHSALSRADNETEICPDCGIKEALGSIGVGEEEQAKILSVIHRYTAD